MTDCTPRVGNHVNVGFDAKVPVLFFLDLLHFRITFLIFVLRRAWLINQGGATTKSVLSVSPWAAKLVLITNSFLAQRLGASNR